MFVNHTLAAILDGSTKMRFMCDSYRSAEPSCNGFSKKRADNPEIFSSYTYPSSAPSFAPTRSPTYSPTQYPTSEPTSEPTSGPTYEPSYNPTDTPTSGPTHNPTTHYATDGPTSQSVCMIFLKIS